MGEDLERLKQRIPLLEYLQRHHWSGRLAGAHDEFVGLCPLHEDTRPSFCINRRKNLFYCHGCGQGGDLIRFVQLSQHLSFRQSLAYLQEELAPSAQLLEYTAAFYQMELHRYPEGIQYLAQRGVHDAALGRFVALKFLPDDLPSGRRRSRHVLPAAAKAFGCCWPLQLRGTC